MSFRNFPTSKTKHRKNNINMRKETNSFRAHHISSISYSSSERTSAFASKGSITLEAAIVVPIFFFAILCLVYLMEIMSVQLMIKNALYSVGREIAQEAYTSSMISPTAIEKQLIEIIGTKKLDNSIIVKGREGLNCNDSRSYWNTSVIDFSVKYQLEIPVLLFRLPIISKEESLRVKGWNGHAESIWVSQEEKIVYVTDYGIVYHEDRQCTYLELSIRQVPLRQIEELRNQSGGKYYACMYCENRLAQTEKVYITDYGNRYHTSLECGKLKRNVYEIPQKDVYGLGGCSKCVE